MPKNRITKILSSIKFENDIFYEVADAKNDKWLSKESEITPASLVARFKKANPDPIIAWEVEEIKSINLDSKMVLVKWTPSPPRPGAAIKRWVDSEIPFDQLYCPNLIKKFQKKCTPFLANRIDTLRKRYGRGGMCKDQ